MKRKTKVQSKEQMMPQAIAEERNEDNIQLLWFSAMNPNFSFYSEALNFFVTFFVSRQKSKINVAKEKLRFQEVPRREHR